MSDEADVTRDEENADADQVGVWIRSESDDEGKYHLTLEVSDDVACGLTQEQALGWARYVIAVAAEAAYDESVLAMTRESLQMAPDLISTLITGARRARRKNVPPLDTGLALEPGVSIKGKAFLHLRTAGELVGQWTVADAIDHVGGMLMAIAGVDLDESMGQVLREDMGLSMTQSRRMIHDLGDHRD